ncbi:ABC transporter permease [Verminephrobacter eiseniae]|uniref:ABC transporter permease n=1 Tax=Verminephrobacter eiseniae TaxID=364317 RepID=UPI0010E27845|nr:ABC transporter permease subunit [Verminephrobacter eiseniae]KAB7604312.1 ABC transporter permease subunit [Verminephrobacter sp. Larva24]MCW5233162.1 ABC transporter permease subunit [Verminephrobacter eiseniae]MCW5295283.1 ABC transporter permease subunit [Verminephrobacter eiseniae]MCW8183555.1 ABC transporter permease subunit [Verminephrobacter eiseniae]MCW8224574.1 ABC transporter permease subunit [Verminephrobacter eiseniae]
MEYFWNVLAAASVTLEMAAGSLLAAIALGLAGAWAKLCGGRWLAAVAGAYTTLVRGVPDLVLMLLFFYGVPALVQLALDTSGSDAGFDVSPLGAGLATLGLIFGGYLTETFRGAILAIPKGQIEAACAFGLGRLRIAWRIVLPQMARLALPGFTNTWLVLVKSTALVSVLGLEDIMFRAKNAAQATRQPFTFFLLTAAVYLSITTVSMLALRWLERRGAHDTRRAPSDPAGRAA